ncbi:hypothetical protein [Candidatus Parabeggiatoa sp. HSG14]|uniref:hypothetical protein n=1 Tax=Candidatus Parabeggiatoa sp. HSG14 TaxID=3055593 RepID=UPI0025A6FC68|nr:hypothetical protein [Thiotrichales bacterium HSG14]
MKRVLSSIVMVEDIKSPTTSKVFSESELEKAAQLILQREGLITPLIVLENGIDSYTLIEGEFEYYAALRAREIDPIKGETINAYVARSEKELPFYEQQIEMFRRSAQTEKPLGDDGNKPPITTNNNTEVLQAIKELRNELSNQFNKSSSQQTKQNNELKNELSNQFNKIGSQQTKQNEEVNNQLKTLQKDVTNVSSPKPKVVDEPLNALPKDVTKISSPKSEQKPELIDDQLKSKLREIFARTKGLGGLKGATLKKILDNWN